MQIQVKLYGTLKQYYTDDDQNRGFYMEVPVGSCVQNVINNLGIPQSKIGMVSINDHLAKVDGKLWDNAMVKIFQPIFGG
jgi:sulfur carrier protein ThiS